MRKEIPEAQPNIEMHPNGLQYRIPLQDIPPELSRIDEGQVMMGLSIYEALNRSQKSLYASRPLLPMPVPTSPLLAYLNATQVWFYTFTFSISSLYLLDQVVVSAMQGHRKFPDSITPERFEALFKDFEYAKEQLFDQVGADLDKIYKASGTPLQQEFILAFIARLERYTLDCINIREVFLWHLFVEHTGVPLERVLTPRIYPEAAVLQQVPKYLDYVRDYFAFKVEVMPESPDLKIGSDAGERYKGYLSWTTARDYFRFEDWGGILQ